MKLAFLGTPELAVPALESLVEAGHEVVLVVSRPDRRRGRGASSSPSPVKAAAERLGLLVTDELGQVAGCGAELGVVVAYGRIIPDELLDQLPMVNIHFSLLPRWRGAAPLERAILAGDATTGVCLMEVVPELDAGGVFARAEIELGDKVLDDLRDELASLGARLLVEELGRGLGDPVPQEGVVTYARKVDASELELDVEGGVEQALRTVRLGRARTTDRGRRLLILAAERCEDLEAARPGELDGTRLRLGDGAIDLLVVQPENRRAMAAADWRRGAGAGASVLGSGGQEP